MSILDAILQGLSRTNQASPLASQDPAASFSMAPEPPAVTAPMQGAGPSIPVAPSMVPQGQEPQHGGILGALGRIFTPDAGSFWDSAWKNGLMGARSGQQEYATAQRQTDQKLTTEAQKSADEHAKAMREANAPHVAGNNVLIPDGKGGWTWSQPTPQPDATERLIDRWHKTPPGPERDIIERAIRGAQYSPEVIQLMGDAHTRTVVAGKKAQRFAPKSGGSGAVKGPGPGFILNP